MNIALPAALILLLIAPGFLALRVRRGNSPYADVVRGPMQPISVEAGLALLSAIAIHALALVIARGLRELCPWIPLVDWPALVTMIAGKPLGADAIGRIANSVGWIASYCVLATSVACVFGVGLAMVATRLPRWVPRRLGLATDKDEIIRQWHDYFRRTDKSVTVVTTVVDMGGTSYLFVGVLDELYFDRHTSQLDRIVLSEVSKRHLDEDDSCFSKVYGSSFVVQYSIIRTLNVYFLEVVDAEDPAQLTLGFDSPGVSGRDNGT